MSLILNSLQFFLWLLHRTGLLFHSRIFHVNQFRFASKINHLQTKKGSLSLPSSCPFWVILAVGYDIDLEVNFFRDQVVGHAGVSNTPLLTLDIEVGLHLDFISRFSTTSALNVMFLEMPLMVRFPDTTT